VIADAVAGLRLTSQLMPSAPDTMRRISRDRSDGNDLRPVREGHQSFAARAHQTAGRHQRRKCAPANHFEIGPRVTRPSSSSAPGSAACGSRGRCAAPRCSRAARPQQLSPVPAIALSGRHRGPRAEEIAKPARAILRGQKNFDFRMVEVTRVDFAAKRLETSAGPIGVRFSRSRARGRDKFLRSRVDAASRLGLKDIPTRSRSAITC